MEDYRLIQHAKGYLDQLAQGVDPISGKAVPEDSVLNQERLSKCFQFVSQVLQRELERLSQPEPAVVKTVVEQLCLSLGFTGKRIFLNRAAHRWLAQEGYVTKRPREDGSATDYIPTQKGERFGFSVKETRGKEDSAYLSLRCDGTGRQLLSDSVDQIMALERQQWTPFLACLTPEWRRQAAVCPEPVSLMGLIDSVNQQLPQDLPRKLTRNDLSAWLLKNGLLEEVIMNGRRTKLPTPEGERLGIVRKGKAGSVWSRDAQRFVLDNLERIARDMASGDAYKLGPQKLVLTGAMRSRILSGPQNMGPKLLEDKINEALKDAGLGARLLPRNLILDWLRREEYLRWEEKEDGLKLRQPTRKGNAVGIIVDDSTGYTLFTEAGQRFVLDNLEKMFDFYYGT